MSNKNLLLTLSHKSPGNTGRLRVRIANAILGLFKENAMKSLIDANIQFWRN